jgi:hypothetical protein
MTRVRAGIPAVGTRQVQGFGSLAFRFLAAIDVEGFSQRHTAEQAQTQDNLEHAMRKAAADAGLDLKRWYRQPRGDGELDVLPEGADGLSLVADYPRMLATAVAAVNQAGKNRSRLRVRMAIHHGAVAPGRFGPVGAAPIAISRLVDSEIVRQQLRQRGDLDIALIVSATVYDEVVQSRLRDLHPEAFRRAIIRAKGITYIGYLCQDILIPGAALSAMPLTLCVLATLMATLTPRCTGILGRRPRPAEQAFHHGAGAPASQHLGRSGLRRGVHVPDQPPWGRRPRRATSVPGQ